MSMPRTYIIGKLEIHLRLNNQLQIMAKKGEDEIL